MPKRATPDDAQIAEQLVRGATGGKPVRGESLLGPELAKVFTEAKKKEAERAKKRK